MNPEKNDEHGPLPVAIWSAGYEALNGQAIVTTRVVSRQDSIVWERFIYSAGKGPAIFRWIVAFLGLWALVLTGRTQTLYLVCSRSGPGFIRDIPALLVSRAGVRVVVHVHGSDIADLLKQRWYSPLARLAYVRTELILPSSHLVAQLSAVSPRALHVCENFLAGEPPGKAVAAMPGRQQVAVLWNSNIISSKGFFDLAQAVGELADAGSRVRLTALGRPLGDDEMSAAQARAALDRIGNCDWLEYRGPVDAAAAAIAVREADIVALPSRYASECQPLALIQAMCEARLILAADTAALRATLGGYPAFFVEPGSVDAIRQSLAGVLAGDGIPSAAALQKAAKIARTRFSHGRFDRDMAQILFERP